jgi:hypothetical protein
MLTKYYKTSYCTSTAYITLKMMELFSSADIQKHPGHMVFVGLEKERMTTVSCWGGEGGHGVTAVVEFLKKQCAHKLSLTCGSVHGFYYF